MKKNLITAFILGLCLLPFTSAPLQAQKVATVDMKKIFEGYYKTKQAEGQIKDRAAESDKVYKGMVDDYQKANDEYRKLVDSANDQTVSAEEREKRKKSAESKLMEIQEIEKSVKQFRSQTQETLANLEKRMRDNIVKEIRDLVNAKGKAGGYNLVFDTSAQTSYQTPFILYAAGQPDLTDDIVKDLNATAPPSANLGAATEAKPEPVKEKKK
jgi:outer membrane protein